MPRRKINFAQDHFYHIYNRGAGRHDLFLERDNYFYVLRRCREYTCLLDLTIIAYCLLPNHYHLLLRQDGPTPAGELPKRVFGGYSRAANRRYGWSGTLFEGRFKARHVGHDDYLRHLCRYIHANPVLAGLARRPEEWPYSNYPEWIGRRRGKLVDRHFVEDLFPDPAAYAQFDADLIEAKQVPEVLAYLEY